VTALRLTLINWFQLTWADDPTHEGWGWDVDAALEIAARKTPTPIRVARIAHFTDAYEVNREYALSDAVDLTRPLLFVLVLGRTTASDEVKALGFPEAALIDGVHRLSKAAHLGLETLPAVFLEPDEERRVRLPHETVQRLLEELEALERFVQASGKRG
jgi:hypothetical protein